MARRALPMEWLIVTSVQRRTLRSAAELVGLLTALGLLHLVRMHPAGWLLGLPR